jgi:2-polyprenyl-3-methyl-5-hydroxy-6-metoxy-1,4-benzoquinol methylase
MDEPPQGPERFIARQLRKRHLAGVWAGLAGLRPGMMVLDIGSGPGVLAAEYARMVGPAGAVYALDPGVALLEPLPNLFALRQDAAAPIAPPRPPDVVFLTDTLHHAADPGAVLRAVHEACGQETVLLAAEYDPAGPGLVGARPHRRMARQTLLDLLRTAGFRVRFVVDAADEHYAARAGRA